MIGTDTHDVPAKSPYGLEVVWWLTTTELDDVLPLYSVEFTIKDLAPFDENQLDRKVNGSAVIADIDDGLGFVSQKDFVNYMIWVSLASSIILRQFTYIQQNIE